MPNYFTVAGLAPTHDPLWRTAPVATRAAFLRAAKAIVLTEWDRQTAEGLDKDGQKLAPLKQSTIKHRRSAMGPADPHAPPLIPAHELSRTRALVDGRVVGTSIRVFWKFDPVSGKRWGTILNYHRRGAGHLPVRDVFGLAPEGLERARRTLELWWAGYSRGLPTVMPTRPAAAKQPAYVPRTPPARMAPSKAADISIGVDTYTMSRSSAAELLAAIKGGKFTGFRSLEDFEPPAAAPPAPKAPPPPRPKPAARPAAAATPFDWSKAINPRLPEFVRQGDELRDRRDRFWVGAAAAANMGDDELKARFDAGLKAAVDAAEPYLRMKPLALEQVLRSGRFKSQFETGTSGGVLSPGTRSHVEAKVMGVPPAIAAGRRPIYGYLGESGFAGFGGPGEAMPAGYGAASVRLKAGALDRATLTIGDSLNKGDELQASKAREPSAASLPMGWEAKAAAAASRLVNEPGNVAENLRLMQRVFSYVELQYHGGLDLSDVAEVAFASQPGPELVRLLAEEGIPWRVIP